MTASERSESAQMLWLAAPLVAQQAGHHLMGVVDAAMLGRYSDAALAGAGVGNNVYFAISCVGMGIVMGMDTIVPHALGGGRIDEARRSVGAGVRLSILVGLIGTLLVLATPSLLALAHVDADVLREARAFGGAWHGIPDIAAAFAEIRAAFPTIGTVPPDIEIFVEPGRLYAQDAGFATGRVLASRELPDRILSVIELSRVCHLRWSQVELLARAPHPGAGRKVQLVGPTCYEEDVIGEWIVEPSELTDRVVLTNVSGYALAWNTSFGGVPAADVVFV